MTELSHGNRYLNAGAKVRLDSIVDDDDQIASEYGIVIHCWEDPALGFFDCYVAFFGAALATGEPQEKPYVLRYAATSLTTIA